MKANHNLKTDNDSLQKLYTKFVKHTFESKPQLSRLLLQFNNYYTQNSSNTLLKANHNQTFVYSGAKLLYTKFVKHTFESKPQHRQS